jgi:choline dehydrogenase-like flavoprotein
MCLISAAFLSFAALATAASVPHGNLKRQVSQLRDKYDFVIVGAGTSGLTVADRLSAAFPASESLRHCIVRLSTNTPVETVLVIEYGDVHFAPGVFDPPTNWLDTIPNPVPSWSFFSLPNPDMGNQTAFVMVGQAVGGSSAANGMFFDRGSRFDYDAWTEVGGPEFAFNSIKWNWDGIFPYFKKVSLVPTPQRITHP